MPSLGHPLHASGGGLQVHLRGSLVRVLRATAIEALTGGLRVLVLHGLFAVDWNEMLVLGELK